MLFQCSAFEKEILIRFHSAGQIIFSTAPQENYFDCHVHLMLPLDCGGGGNMTKKILVGSLLSNITEAEFKNALISLVQLLMLSYCMITTRRGQEGLPLLLFIGLIGLLVCFSFRILNLSFV